MFFLRSLSIGSLLLGFTNKSSMHGTGQLFFLTISFDWITCIYLKLSLFLGKKPTCGSIRSLSIKSLTQNIRPCHLNFHRLWLYILTYHKAKNLYWRLYGPSNTTNVAVFIWPLANEIKCNTTPTRIKFKNFLSLLRRLLARPERVLYSSLCTKALSNTNWEKSELKNSLSHSKGDEWSFHFMFPCYFAVHSNTFALICELLTYLNMF